MKRAAEKAGIENRNIFTDAQKDVFVAVNNN